MRTGGMKQRLLAGAVAAVCAPAAAQPAVESQTGSHILIPRRARIPENTASDRVRISRQVMSEFARCVVDREPKAVARAVSASSQRDFDKAVDALSTDECLDSGMMRFKTDAMRGPLFVELYRRRADAEAHQKPWGPVAPKINLGTTPAQDSIDGEHLPWLSFGECVVSTDSGAAQAIVLAPTASDLQDAAFAKAGAAFNACVSQGTTIRMGKQAIEAVLAEVLYRGVEPLAVATSTSTSEAK